MKLILAVAFTLLLAAGADGYTTRSLDVVTVIRSRFAETIISSRVYNNKNYSEEVKFQSILPKDAFITAFSFTINENTYDGIIKEKVAAEKIYNKLKKKGKTTGIVRTRDESVSNFKTSVNVGAGEIVLFKLTYVELLNKRSNKYTHRIALLESQFIKPLTINTFICETSEITNVTILPFVNAKGVSLKANSTVVNEGNYAHIEFFPSQSPSLKSLLSGGGSYTMEYELEVPQNGSSFVVDKGYFIHFFDPAKLPDAKPKKSFPRRLLFVLDSSGSMSGLKLKQLKTAMRYIIKNLDNEDIFGIIDFDSYAKPWRYNGTMLVPVTPESKASALDFISRMSDDGGTEIYKALVMGLRTFATEIPKAERSSLSNNIVFLTDGQDYSSKSIFDVIPKHKSVQMHSIGLGQGVNADFLKKLAAETGGSWTQIFEDTNVVIQIQDFVTNLGRYENTQLNITYPKIVDEKLSLNEGKMLVGGELVTIGKFGNVHHPEAKHTLTVKGKKKETVKLDFTLDQSPPTCSRISEKKLKKYMWQIFGIVKTREALQLYDQYSYDETYKQKAINSSLKYQLVTPVTAMIVITPEAEEALKEDEEEESKNEPEKKKNSVPDSLRKKSKWLSGSGDPHFVMHISNNFSLCFNLYGEHGQILNLLSDETNGVIINAQLTTVGGQDHGTYFSKMVVLSQKLGMAVVLEPGTLFVRNMKEKNPSLRDFYFRVNDTDPYERVVGPIHLSVSDVQRAFTLLTITINGTISVSFELHHSPSSAKVPHIDFIESEITSDAMKGIAGTFIRASKKLPKHPTLIQRKDESHLWFKKNWLQVSSREMFVPILKTKQQCWFVKKLRHVLGHSVSYFTVENLFGIPHYVVN